MRALQLQTPNMSGPDVAGWQTFLTSRGVYQSTVDGFFGQKSDSATRAYQTNAGLGADGVVGANTMAKAVADGYRPTAGANIGGMDTRTACGGFGGDISGAGIAFVARYYSNVSDKTLTVAEAKELSGAGISIVAVYEDSNDAVDFFSSAIGSSQAARALELAASIGQPAGTAIYFAVDFDPESDDIEGVISDYFRALQAAFAAAPTQYAVGVYGSGLTCRLIQSAGFATFTWLAQSTGFQEYSSFLPSAHIVQLFPSRNLTAGLSIDDNIAQAAAFGAFRVGQAIAETT
jgi:peptidoglycan hydrolase-like protein with peptidoglycan-binding domain